MPRNGVGTWTAPAGNPVITGTTIISTAFNNTIADIGNALTTSIATDGQTPALANLPMGTNRHTGVGDAQARTDYASAGQVQNNALTNLTTIAGTNTITAVAPLGMLAYATGQNFTLIATGNNTGAVTLNINGIGEKAVTKNGTTALIANDILNGSAYQVIYDGTQFQLANAAISDGSVTTAKIANNAITPEKLSTGGLFWDTSGNVGIGTSYPSAKLDVAGSGQQIVRAITTDTSGVNVARFVARYTGGSGGLTSQIDIRAGDGYSYLVTETNTPILFGTNITERMRIDANGNVLVNATSQPSGVNGKMYVGGIFSTSAYQCRAGGAGTWSPSVFNINWTGSPQLWIDNTKVGTIAFTSDYRIKKNIETNTALALERIAQIRPVTYEFANYGELFKEDGIAREGFIAHELQAVIPSAVEGKKDVENQIQSLKLDALCSVMVKAIQELKAIVDTQAEQIKSLQGAK